MGLNKLIARLYPKVYVGITVSNTDMHAVVELCQNGDVREHISKHFEEVSVQTMKTFLDAYLSESPFHYVALLNNRDEQGALPVCADQKAREFIDTAMTISLCQKRGWMLYAYKPDLDDLKKEYAGIGLDFIFSPFSILERFFADKIGSAASLYVLAEEDAVSACVFADDKLLYARRLGIGREDDMMLGEESNHNAISLSFELEAEGIEEGLELDDINAIDDLDGLDDLQEIEDLDMADDLETFAEEDEAPVEDTAVDDSDETVTMEGFNKDYKRFQLIQTALHHYYSESKYDNRFVESVYVADGCGLSDDLKHYLEEELFMKVYVRKIDIASEIVDLAKTEADHAS